MDKHGGAGAKYSVALPRRQWYPACPSKDLTDRAVGITLMDEPIALFRGRGGPAALADRCAHRNAPLSLGRVAADGCLECAYHGWRYDGVGVCTAVPGLPEPIAPSPAREVTSYATTEQDGFVWIWGDPDSDPTGKPFALPQLEGRHVGEVVFRYDLDATLHAALENALDVPHTAFLHRGIFRGGDAREITAERRELPNGIEVQYLGEPVGLGKVRGSQDTELTFDHWDRFFLPSIAQVEYRVKDWLQIVNTILHLPLSPFRTRAWFVVRFRTPVPVPLVKPIVLARGLQIVRQDVKILARQTENVRRFGGERYASTELDVFGNAIWRMLRTAERAEQEGGATNGRKSSVGQVPTVAEPVEQSVTFKI